MFTDIPTQNVLDIKLALFQTFQNIDMPVHKDKMVFLVSHDASVNSRVKAGLATKFLEWLTRMDGIRMVFVSLLRAVIKRKFRWQVRTSQEKSYSLVLLVPQAN